MTSPPKNLKTPQNLQINNFILTWDAVANATEYIVDINGTENQTVSTSLDLSTINIGSYQIKVMAKGDGVKFTDSQWSEVIPFTREAPDTSLTIPSNLKLKVTLTAPKTLSLGPLKPIKHSRN